MTFPLNIPRNPTFSAHTAMIENLSTACKILISYPGSTVPFYGPIGGLGPMGGPLGGFGPFGGFGGFGGGFGGAGAGGQWIGPFLIPIPNFGGTTTTTNNDRNAAARGQAEMYFSILAISISVFVILRS